MRSAMVNVSLDRSHLWRRDVPAAIEFATIHRQNKGQGMGKSGAFLRNSWYVAAQADEIGRAPLGRILLSEPVVMFRQEDGTPVALEDRCCHRRAPLHKGKALDGSNDQGRDRRGLARCVETSPDGGTV